MYSLVYRETNRAADYLASFHPGENFVEVDPVNFDSKLAKIVVRIVVILSTIVNRFFLLGLFVFV